MSFCFLPIPSMYSSIVIKSFDFEFLKNYQDCNTHQIPKHFPEINIIKKSIIPPKIIIGNATYKKIR